MASQAQKEWEFRKTIESFEHYKKTQQYRNLIDQGDKSVFKMCLREIQIILTQPKQKIVSKVLALRFLKDIMVLGRQDVVLGVQKIIPLLLKVCSYKLQSSDINRGQSFFHEHPSYLKAQKEQERFQIDQLGSTFLTLSLQSIIHWAKWVPLDETGQMTIYAKAYNDLLQRGVRFPLEFHYYKQSDTQKFKNQYRIQFFPDSYCTSQISVQNESLLESRANQSRKISNEEEQEIDIQIFKKTSITTITQITEYLQRLAKQPTANAEKRLSSINKRLLQIYDQQFDQSKLKNRQVKLAKTWVDRFFVYYNFYVYKKIDLKQFLRKVNMEQIVLGNEEEEGVSVNIKNQDSSFKMYKSPKKQGTKSTFELQELFKKQQLQYNMKIYNLKNQLDEKTREISNIKSIHEREKQELIEDYERRMDFLKTSVATSRKDKDAPLIIELEYENEQLRKKIAVIQTQLIYHQKTIQEQFQIQNSRLQGQASKLKLENQKLFNIINEKNQKQNRLKLESEFYGSKFNSKNSYLNESSNKFNQPKTIELEQIIQEKDEQIKRFQKEIRRIRDELELYKTELNRQRLKKDSKSGPLQKKIEHLQLENKQLKEKLHTAKKSIDVKDVQIMKIKEEYRIFQLKVKQFNLRKNQSESQIWSNQQRISFKQEIYLENVHKKIRFPNYQDIYLKLKAVNKQTFLRLCRSSFRKKDILFKENQLQIGVISEMISDNKISFLLHFTNLAENQIEDIKIKPLPTETTVSKLHYDLNMQYIYSIQPQEQQKVQCIVTNTEAPYIKQRAIIIVTYRKNNSVFNHRIFLPFMIPKFLVNTAPSTHHVNPNFIKEELTIRYSKKMLPYPSYIKTYFEHILERIQEKKYEVELYHKDTDLGLHLTFNFGDNLALNIEAICLHQKMNDRRKYVFEEILSFIEVAFKK